MKSYLSLFLTLFIGTFASFEVSARCTSEQIGLDLQQLNRASLRVETIDRLIKSKDYELALELIRDWSRSFSTDRLTTLKRCRFDERVRRMETQWKQLEQSMASYKAMNFSASPSLCERMKEEVIESYQQAIALYEEHGADHSIAKFMNSAKLAEETLHRGECERKKRAMLENIARHSWKAVPSYDPLTSL